MIRCVVLKYTMS